MKKLYNVISENFLEPLSNKLNAFQFTILLGILPAAILFGSVFFLTGSLFYAFMSTLPLTIFSIWINVMIELDIQDLQEQIRMQKKLKSLIDEANIAFSNNLIDVLKPEWREFVNLGTKHAFNTTEDDIVKLHQLLNKSYKRVQ